jgi:hypothetical protein
MDSEQADLWTRSCRYLLSEGDQCGGEGPRRREAGDEMDCVIEDLSPAQQDEYWLRERKRLEMVRRLLEKQSGVRSPDPAVSASSPRRGRGDRCLYEKCRRIYIE